MRFGDPSDENSLPPPLRYCAEICPIGREQYSTTLESNKLPEKLCPFAASTLLREFAGSRIEDEVDVRATIGGESSDPQEHPDIVRFTVAAFRGLLVFQENASICSRTMKTKAETPEDPALIVGPEILGETCDILDQYIEERTYTLGQIVAAKTRSRQN